VADCRAVRSAPAFRERSRCKIAAFVSRGGVVLEIGIFAPRMCRVSGMLALIPRCARGEAGRGISDARVGREVQSEVSDLSAIPAFLGLALPFSADGRVFAVFLFARALRRPEWQGQPLA